MCPALNCAIWCVCVCVCVGVVVVVVLWGFWLLLFVCFSFVVVVGFFVVVVVFAEGYRYNQQRNSSFFTVSDSANKMRGKKEFLVN